LLSVVGIGVGCGVCLFLIGFVRGEEEMMLRAAAESGAGHLRVVPADWPATRNNKLRLPRWQQSLRTLRQLPGLTTVTPRARSDALLAFGVRLAGVEAVGVDPATEQAANRLVRTVVAGHYLKPGETGTVVIGQALAERLDVDVEDELMITATGADGEMKSGMLRIAGIVATGSRDLDAAICHASLADITRLTGLPGAGELTALVEDPDKLPNLVDEVAAALPKGHAVVIWAELMPELAAGVRMDHVWTNLTVGIVVTVVFLGIASAQLAAVLERRREFAVLSALGMKHGRLIQVMLTEGLILGGLGALLGLALGAPATYYIATAGIDFSALYGNTDVTVSNILIDPVFYGDFGWWIVPLALLLALLATMLSSIYPAWFASRTDPATALRVEH
jgi:ABC-type lipoprotein release transport system permease subunit